MEHILEGCSDRVHFRLSILVCGDLPHPGAAFLCFYPRLPGTRLRRLRDRRPGRWKSLAIYPPTRSPSRRRSASLFTQILFGWAGGLDDDLPTRWPFICACFCTPLAYDFCSSFCCIAWTVVDCTDGRFGRWFHRFYPE